MSKTSNPQGGGWGKLKKLHSQIIFWVVVIGDFWTDACLCFLSLDWVCRAGSLSRDLLLWNVFVLIFMWRSFSPGLNLSSPPSVSDSPSQLEAFWTLSLISLGRLEHFTSLFYVLVSMYTKILVMQGIRTNNFSLSSSFCLFSFFVLLNFLFLPSCRVRPLTFPSSLSESPLLGHQSSEAARWKHNLLLVQHVNLFHRSKMEPSCIFLIIFQMLITLARNCLQLERQWAPLCGENTVGFALAFHCTLLC